MLVRAQARPEGQQSMSKRLLHIEFKPRAVKDLDSLDRPTARRVLEKIRELKTIWRAT
jgi:hypothetical protein